MNKKWAAILLTATILAPQTALMAGEEVTEVNTQVEHVQEERNEYLTKKGKVTEVAKEGENYSILVGTPEEGTRFIIQDGQMIVDAETLAYLKADQIQEGMEVTVILAKNAPMGLSLPPVTGAQTAIIVNSDKRFVTQGFFNEELINEENTLALNIEESTTIVSTTGEKRIFTAEDVKNQNAVVIYTNSTRSIPAQTTPKWVLVLPTTQETAPEHVEELEQKERAVKGVNEVSVREIADKYGYTISWDHVTKRVTLTKGEQSISLTVGEKQYLVNQVEKELTGPVKLEQDHVIVSDEILEQLL